MNEIPLEWLKILASLNLSPRIKLLSMLGFTKALYNSQTHALNNNNNQPRLEQNNNNNQHTR